MPTVVCDKYRSVISCYGDDVLKLLFPDKIIVFVDLYTYLHTYRVLKLKCLPVKFRNSFGEIFHANALFKCTPPSVNFRIILTGYREIPPTDTMRRQDKVILAKLAAGCGGNCYVLCRTRVIGLPGAVLLVYFA